jgi:hypothetical protein
MSTGQDKHTPPSEAPTADPSIAAFDHDLPELLRTHSGKWVAYYGDQCLGFARTQTELYQRCIQRGLKEAEFIVRFIDAAALADHDEIDIPWHP